MKIQFDNGQICIFESAIYRTTSTLIILEEAAVLIDPNYFPIEIEFIQKYIEENAAEKPLIVIFTHSDFDHIVGAYAFEAMDYIASLAFNSDESRKKGMKQLLHFEAYNYISRNYPIKYPEITIAIEKDYQRIDFGKDTIEFFMTPGHNNDGMAIHFPDQGILVAGDYLSNIEFPFIYDDVLSYYASLKKFEKAINTRNVRMLVPGHGDHCSDQKEMQKRVDDSRDYLNELLKSKKADREFDESLLSSYEYMEGMKESHVANINLS